MRHDWREDEGRSTLCKNDQTAGASNYDFAEVLGLNLKRMPLLTVAWSMGFKVFSRFAQRMNGDLENQTLVN